MIQPENASSSFGVYVILIAGLVFAVIIGVVCGFMIPKILRKNQKKQDHIKVFFKKRSLLDEKGQLLGKIRNKKGGPLFSCLVFLAVFCYMAYTVVIKENGDEYYLYMASSFLAVCYNILLMSRAVIFYDNAIVVRQIFGGKTYFLNEIDSLESFVVLGNFGTPKGIGYGLKSDGKDIFSITEKNYANIHIAQDIYTMANANVEGVQIIPKEMQ